MTLLFEHARRHRRPGAPALLRAYCERTGKTIGQLEREARVTDGGLDAQALELQRRRAAMRK